MHQPTGQEEIDQVAQESTMQLWLIIKGLKMVWCGLVGHPMRPQGLQHKTIPTPNQVCQRCGQFRVTVKRDWYVSPS